MLSIHSEFEAAASSGRPSGLRAHVAALLGAVLLAACGGDPSIGEQDITFALAAEPQPPLAQGGESAAPVVVIDEDLEDSLDEAEPFSAAVALRLVDPMPPGIDADFAPSTIRPGETAQLAVRADDDAQAGRHQLLLAGTIASGTGTRYLPHPVNVTASCAPGTEPIRHVYPSRMARTIGLTRSGAVYLWGHNADAHPTESPGEEAVPRALSFYTAQHIAELPATVSAASARGASVLVLAGGGELRVLTSHYRSEVRAPEGRTGWFIYAVPEFTGFRQVVADGGNFYALHEDGSVWRVSASAQGIDGTLHFAPPTQVTGFADVTQIAAGTNHLLALRHDGTVLAMGVNEHGQLGNGGTETGHTPAAVPGVVDVIRIAAGDEHSLALRANGTMLAWGRGDHGQLGNGLRLDALSPVEVVSANNNVVSGIIDATAGAAHSLAHRADGTALAWGRGAEGQLGTGASEALTPVAVDAGFADQVIAAGNSSFRVAFGTGRVQGWGDNTEGLLGDGTTQPRAAPVDALGLGWGETRHCREDEPPPSGDLVELSLAVQGPGRVSGDGFSCREGLSTEGCVREVPSGTSITLVAEPDADAVFQGWTGCTVSESASITVTVESSTRCFASFGSQ